MRSKEVAIIGAGKIGRGFLADLFGRAGYHLIFINGSPKTIDKLNEQKQYTLFTTGPEGTTRKIISGYEAYSSQRDFDTVVKRLSEVDLACVSLYPQAYPNVADQLAGAVKKRRADGVEEPLNVLFFVNVVYPSRIFHELMSERLTDPQDRAYFESHVGLVEALTFRGGYNPTPEMLAEDPLCISSSPGEVLPVGDNFVGEKPSDIPSMQFLDRMQGRLVRKVWCGNMGHCMQAVIGRMRGYTYIYECARDQYIRKCTDYATQEANFGVGQEFGFTPEEMRENTRGRTWKDRQNSNSKDDVYRVAADPLRKLGHGDRFVGPALLCLKHGRVPYYLARGAAYLLFFQNEKDASAVEMHRIIDTQGIEKAIETICGLDLQKPDENQLYQLILAQYREILDHDVDPQTL